MSPLDPMPGRRVLVVDDDPNLLELVRTRLELAGCATHGARNGIEALAGIAEFQPEAMVLDINMPVLDGFGVLTRMRERGLTEKVRTMVLTARNNPPDVAHAIQLGARDDLSKPFKDAQLLLRVARLLVRSREAANR
jgi:two-component system OmpR family response regulator